MKCAPDHRSEGRLFFLADDFQRLRIYLQIIFHAFGVAGVIHFPTPVVEFDFFPAYKALRAQHLFNGGAFRSEEHTSELQSLMRISYAVFSLKKKKITLSTKSETYSPYSAN